VYSDQSYRTDRAGKSGTYSCPNMLSVYYLKTFKTLEVVVVVKATKDLP